MKEESERNRTGQKQQPLLPSPYKLPVQAIDWLLTSENVYQVKDIHHIEALQHLFVSDGPGTQNKDAVLRMK